MRVPLSWLADFVTVEMDPEALADRLTGVGLKVEAIHRPGAGVEGVVVGEVLAIAPHPGADKLVLVDVRVDGGDRRIVCGARNFAVGDRVPVALPGAALPGGVEIGRRPIAGQPSDGMLCSARELGVSDDHSGILVLPPDAEVGADVRKVLGLDEVILEIEVTPNRPDAMSLLGIAREVAACTGAELRMPEAPVREGQAPVEDLAAVEVLDGEGCPRYLARVVRGVAVGPSPDWAQRRLTAAGMRPISSVVDATNYALAVTGHPMHAFDLDRLEGRRIVVRRARPGEHLTTLDGADRALDPDDLVIADAVRPVALAGIMGGADTEVSEATADVLLESAHFQPTSIYRASRRHALRTEASARFERGADPNAAAAAADYACTLIQQWAGGEVAAGALDAYPSPVPARVVVLRSERANGVLGTDLAPGEIAVALARLGLAAEEEGASIRVTVPTRRPDVTAEEDLVEEVARSIGYDRIPSTLPAGSNRAGRLTREQRLLRRVRSVLAGAGLFEAQTSTLIGPSNLDRMAYPEGHPARAALRLANPMVADESLLRPSLLPGLIAAVGRNVARRNLSVKLFEVGRCFRPSGAILPEEPLRLGVAMHGPVPQEWHSPERAMDLFDLKGVVEALLEALRIRGAAFAPVSVEPFHPGRGASLRVGERDLGVLGELGPETCERHDLPGRALAAELDLEGLLQAAEPPVEVVEPARFPAVLLDLAFAVQEEVAAAALLAAAGEAGGEALEEVRIFDVYRGDQVGPGRKSVALSLTFRRRDRTLTEAEALAARDAIAAAIARRLGGEVRR